MSIVRVGLSENKDFASGYEAIFGKKKAAAKKEAAKPAKAPAAEAGKKKGKGKK